jgi:hypothetical protein
MTNRAYNHAAIIMKTSERMKDHQSVPPASDLLSREERDSMTLSLSEKTASRPSLAQDRMMFNRMSLLALNNGTGRRDSDSEEFAEFFRPEEDLEGGRIKICQYLDTLELSAQKLVLDQERRDFKPKPAATVGQRLKSSIRNLKRIAWSAVDALLPTSWQTVPKVEMIEGLQNQQQRDLQQAERKCQHDLKAIGRGYDAIKAYVANFYSDLIAPFDYTDASQMEGFLDACLNDETSLHYKNVQRIIERRHQARLKSHEEEKARILADNSSEETIAEIRESSWLLRTMDQIAKRKDQVRQKQTLVKPALQPTTAAADSAGPLLPRRWFNRLAAAAALLTTTLVMGGDNDDSADKTVNREQVALSTPEKINGQPKANTAPAPAEQISRPTKETEKQPEKTAKADKPQVRTAAPKHAAATQRLALNKAKTTALPLKQADLAPDREDTLTERKRTEKKEQTNQLTEAEKLAQIRLLEGKVSAYKHRLFLVQKDSSRFPGNTETGKAINADLSEISRTLDQIVKELQALEIKAQTDQIEQQIGKMDRLMSRIEIRTAAVNIATAQTSSLTALDLMQKTGSLSRVKGNHFTIEHHDRAKGSITYDVDLAKIQQRLQEIHQQSKNSQDLTLAQAQLLNRDAQYWVGYLNFVNWYLQYNPSKVAARA